MVRYYGLTWAVHLSVHQYVARPSIFSFPDDNLSKCQWIFTKLWNGMCIDVVEIWFGIANGQILYTLPHNSGRVLKFHIWLTLCTSTHRSVICPSLFSFPDDSLSYYQWLFTKLGVCIDIVEDLAWDCHWANFLVFFFLSSYLPRTCQWIFRVRVLKFHIWLTLCTSTHRSVIHVYVHLYFHFRMIAWVNVSGFLPNLPCALIFCRSCLGWLMGKFCQFLNLF